MEDTGMTSYAGQREWQRGRPKDPRCSHLGVTDMEVEHSSGTLRLNPNTLLHMAHDSTLLQLLPVPGVVSLISGEPAIIYRTDEVEVALTPQELDRLALGSLTPEQFFAVCDAVGAIYEIRSSYYDPDTGEAMDARSERYMETEDTKTRRHAAIGSAVLGLQPLVDAMKLMKADGLAVSLEITGINNTVPSSVRATAILPDIKARDGQLATYLIIVRDNLVTLEPETADGIEPEWREAFEIRQDDLDRTIADLVNDVTEAAKSANGIGL